MFEKNYRLVGKHATYAKFLKDDAKLFDICPNNSIKQLAYFQMLINDV